MLLQTFTLTTSPNDEVRQWIEVIAIATSPIITIVLWQLNVSKKIKRERIKLIATLTPVLAKSANYFHNIERLEIQFQKAGVTVRTTNNEKNKDYWMSQLSIVRASIDKLQMKWLDASSESAILFNKLTAYISKEQNVKIHAMLMDLGKINRKQFVEDFENLDIPQAELKAKEILKEITENDEVGKRVLEISKSLQEILRKKKCNTFCKYYCCCCCCYFD